ncbi:MAG: hypothetical protein PHR71_04230 [Polaromonas sp.]|nr:hypothetical protein [Polaromonas sp.]
MLFDLLPGLLTSAVINGVMAAPIMARLMLLAGEKSVTGNFTLDARTTQLGWDDAAVVGFVVLMMFRDVVCQIFQANQTVNHVLPRDCYGRGPDYRFRNGLLQSRH